MKWIPDWQYSRGAFFYLTPVATSSTAAKKSLHVSKWRSPGLFWMANFMCLSVAWWKVTLLRMPYWTINVASQKPFWDTHWVSHFIEMNRSPSWTLWALKILRKFCPTRPHFEEEGPTKHFSAAISVVTTVITNKQFLYFSV